MICHDFFVEIFWVKHVFPVVSQRPHHKRLSKFKADLIINFGPGRVCLSSYFSSTTKSPLETLRYSAFTLYSWIVGAAYDGRFFHHFFSAAFLSYSLSSRITYLNLSHRHLVILCIHLLIIAEDVSQLVVVLVLVLVENLKVDSF